MTTRLCSDWQGVKDLLDGLAATISDGSLKHEPITPDDLGIPGYEGHAWGMLVRPEDVVERAPVPDGQLEVSRYVAPGMLDVNPEDPREGHELALRFRLLVLRRIGADVFAGMVYRDGTSTPFLGGDLVDGDAAKAAWQTLEVLRHARLGPRRGAQPGQGRRFPSRQAYWDELAPIVWSLNRGEDATEEAVARQLSLALDGRPADAKTVAKWAGEYWGSWPDFVQAVQQAFA